MLHVNGNFHSEGGLGAPEHLRAYRAGTRTLVVTIIRAKSDPQGGADSLKGLGDFVITTDGSASVTQ